MNDSYSVRAHLSLNDAARKLLNLMDFKQTNVCVACDVTCQNQLLEFAEILGPHICLFKTHVDILENYTPSFGAILREIADKHNFMIFEDRKFADIGATVQLQYRHGIYKIADWADFINIHPLVGSQSIESLRQVGKDRGRGLLLIAEMSSKGNLINTHYVKNTLRMAEEYSDFCAGFISQNRLSPLFIHMTPGVKFEKGIDALGQQYNDPQSVIERGSDVIIVGRGIIEAKNPLDSVQEYRQAGWLAYRNRITISS